MCSTLPSIAAYLMQRIASVWHAMMEAAQCTACSHNKSHSSSSMLHALRHSRRSAASQNVHSLQQLRRHAGPACALNAWSACLSRQTKPSVYGLEQLSSLGSVSGCYCTASVTA